MAISHHGVDGVRHNTDQLTIAHRDTKSCWIDQQASEPAWSLSGPQWAGVLTTLNSVRQQSARVGQAAACALAMALAPCMSGQLLCGRQCVCVHKRSELGRAQRHSRACPCKLAGCVFKCAAVKNTRTAAALCCTSAPALGGHAFADILSRGLWGTRLEQRLRAAPCSLTRHI